MMPKKFLLRLTAPTMVIVILISGCLQQKLPELPKKNLSFMGVQGTEFMLDGQPFHFVGVFAFPALTHLLYEPQRSTTYEKDLDIYLEKLPRDIRVIRVSAFGPYTQHVSNSTEPNWERLDYLAKSAEQHGVYIIWVLYDYWDYGPTGTLSDYHHQFWQDESAEQAILKQVKRYKDSPAIFGWELMNEGDAQTIWNETERPEVLAWVEDVSQAVKAVDNRHLVSSGFSDENLRETYFNFPDAYPTAREFVLNVHKLPTIDFMTFHAYGGNPDQQTSADFFTEQWKSEMVWYLDEMARLKNEAGKPVVLEEFGAQRQVGEPTRKRLYDFMFDQATKRNISCLFNTWGDDRAPSGFSIYTYDEEHYSVEDAAVRMLST